MVKHATTGDGTKVTDPVWSEDHDPSTSGAGVELIWKDSPSSAWSVTGQTSGISMTDLDLTSVTSANAKMVYLALKMTASVIGSGNLSAIGVRKNGTGPAEFPEIILHKDGVTANAVQYAWVIVGMDSSQIIEYQLTVGTGWTVDASIWVLAYWE